uniref:40S ribosomal protein S30 n=1 Tax=Ascaris suum TaxID=6253 RepID=F1LFG8_ASCSU
MQVLINAIDGQVHLVEVTPETTIAQLKSQLEAFDSVLTFGTRILDEDDCSLSQLEAFDSVLTFGTRILDEDDCSLSQLDIVHGSTLNINARLIGGKVHGSLARAGKVRAQTPKVDKQEKKKKKTGRAARRIQYNRRFVNVALNGPGRKRGPNSNAA